MLFAPETQKSVDVTKADDRQTIKIGRFLLHDRFYVTVKSTDEIVLYRLSVIGLSVKVKSVSTHKWYKVL